ncbi:hypothetical protein [Cutibacterium modestum]|uniref:Beta-lactamase-related domain-containing protein n=1 Tax=Cutibacterium modestum HL044PA1 TaxID=765109 RepID=A0ABP2K4N0_9ACTN|nr:hypothetical protein [Cutibacterium modestum]EFS75054.1 hypothetical protein HMPREF9621_00686 [Cutibacterium modestum HL037PA2]EFS91817.1 hypothetical protein HMPREF9607_01978 [Cutibacterium modestum HL044PA1]EFT15822.1 hypothetical protein HMPREF9622_01071 [Cutibacterium modestum HL037PA3]EGG26878.1 hypothetical protein PA08_1115 [Cutibacterium modestum P08]
MTSRRPTRDDTLARWIPQLRPSVTGATIRDALTMSTGLLPGDP